jgi:hypothetical protein
MHRALRICWRVGWFVAVLLTFGAGCGGREFAEVEGTVTLDGKPLPDVEIVFVPAAARGNNANAYTDAQGRYKLQTARDRKDGTAPGRFQVTIIDLLAVPDVSSLGGAPGSSQSVPNAERPKVSRVPVAYSYPDRTPFQGVEVKPGKQTQNFDVKTRRR